MVRRPKCRGEIHTFPKLLDDLRFLLRFLLNKPLILGNSYVFDHVRITWTLFSREFLQVVIDGAQVSPEEALITHVDTLQRRQNPTHPTTLGWPCQPLKHYGNDRFVHRCSKAKILCTVLRANILGCHATYNGCGRFDVPLNLIGRVLVVRRMTCCVTLVCVTDVRPALVTVTLQVLNKYLHLVLNVPVITEEEVWSRRYFLQIYTTFICKKRQSNH